jgi:hypothetical protein
MFSRMKLAVDAIDAAVRGIAQAPSISHYRIEDGLQIGLCVADDPQDLARCRLLLQRLGQVPVADLQFREQPHVLDGDDRLVGEGLEQSDLPLREAPNLGTADVDRTDCEPFFSSRGKLSTERGASAIERWRPRPTICSPRLPHERILPTS